MKSSPSKARAHLSEVTSEERQLILHSSENEMTNDDRCNYYAQIMNVSMINLVSQHILLVANIAMLCTVNLIGFRIYSIY